MLEKCQNCLHAELAPAEHSAMDVKGMGLVMIPQIEHSDECWSWVKT